MDETTYFSPTSVGRGEFWKLVCVFFGHLEVKVKNGSHHDPIRRDWAHPASFTACDVCRVVLRVDGCDYSR